MAEQFVGGSGEEFVSRSIDMAKGANLVALCLCIERLVPARHRKVIGFELPRIERAQYIAAAAAQSSKQRQTASCRREFMNVLKLPRASIETGELGH